MATFPDRASGWPGDPERPNPLRVALAVAALLGIAWISIQPADLTGQLGSALPVASPSGAVRPVQSGPTAPDRLAGETPALSCATPAGGASPVRDVPATFSCELDVVAGGHGTLDLEHLAGLDFARGDTFRLASGPDHGQATLDGATVLYRPTSGYLGADGLGIELRRSDGTVVPVELGITVMPRPASLHLTLDSPAALAPGQPVVVSWSIEGHWPATELLVRAVEPGQVDPSTGPYAVRPGVRPANGPVHYLRPAGGWSEAPEGYLATPGSGRASFTLPAEAEGEWRVEVQLRDRATGLIDATSTASVLVTARPAMLLRVGRDVVGPDQPVQVQATVGGARADQPVRVEASLIGPDGESTPLPVDQALSGAPAGSAPISILDQGFAPADRGAYRVVARLIDARRGTPLGVADAGFSVCDRSAIVRGTVVDESGQSLAAGGRISGAVEAFDLDLGAVTATAPLGESASYRLVLAPGRYLLLAPLFDPTGWRQATALDPVTVDCSGPPAPVDLIAGPPAPLPAGAGWLAAPSGPSGTLVADGQLPATGACDPSSRPVVLVEGQDPGNGTASTDQLLAEAFGGELAAAAPDVAVATPGSRAVATTFSALEVPGGLVRTLDVAPPDWPPAPDADLVVHASAPLAVLTAVLEDSNGNILWRAEDAAPAGTALSSVLVAHLAAAAAHPLGRDLGCVLAAPNHPSPAFVPARSTSTARSKPTDDAELDLISLDVPLSGGEPTVDDAHLARFVAWVQQDGAPLPWVPVTFHLRDGTLNGGDTQTDASGEAGIAYAAPVSGAGTSLLSAEAVVGDQRLTRTVLIHYRAGRPCPIRPGATFTAFCVTDLGPSGPADSGATGESLGGAGLDSAATVRRLGRSSFLDWSIDPGSGWRVLHGYDTGANGPIFAYGTVDGQPHAFLLTPR